jgi:hypothetical protein
MFGSREGLTSNNVRANYRDRDDTETFGLAQKAAFSIDSKTGHFRLSIRRWGYSMITFTPSPKTDGCAAGIGIYTSDSTSAGRKHPSVVQP